jgi:ankyrin repeat protein
MDLLDLPPEIFQMVVHEFVSKVGVRKAWKCRSVCRNFLQQVSGSFRSPSLGSFAVEIHHDVFAKQSIAALSRCESILKRNLALYLFNRTKNLLDVNDFVPNKIKRAVNFLMENCRYDGTTQRDELTKIICDGFRPDILSGVIYYNLRDGQGSSFLVRPLDPSDGWEQCTHAEENIATAALIGDHHLVRTLLASIKPELANLSRYGIFGNPLSNAFQSGSQDTITVILEHLHSNVSPFPSSRSAVTDAIKLAIELRETDSVKQLLAWYQSHCLPEKGIYNTWLLCAITVRDPVIVRHLLQVKIKSSPRVTFKNFEHACLLESPEIVTMLLGRGLIDADKKNGVSSPLTCAVYHGDIGCIQAVLKAGAHIDGTRASGKIRNAPNPLAVAVRLSQVDVVKFLLKRGANPEKDRERRPTLLLDLAVQGRTMDTDKKAIYDMLRRALLMKNAEANLPTFEERIKERRTRTRKRQ